MHNAAFNPGQRGKWRGLYNQCVLQITVPFGRWLGVPVRVHLSLFLLLALAVSYSEVATGRLLRGLGLWLALCAAILVRELARAIAAAYAGAPLRALYLLPFGAVVALEPREGGLAPGSQRLIALAGAGANLLAALLLAGFAYSVEPTVTLLRQPWIGIGHILRSAVWLQAALGIINLLPTGSLPLQPFLGGAAGRPPAPATNFAASAGEEPGPGGVNEKSQGGQRLGSRILGSRTSGNRLIPGRRPAFGLGTALALALLAVGIFLGLLWPVLLGVTLLFLNYVTKVASVSTADAATLTVAEVMLTDFAPLSASSTLRDALRRTNHVLGDVFPVVRGDRLVGWISRTALATRLQTEGDGYLQGAMARSLQIATPGEKLPEALRRVAASGASEFVPVVENGAIIGVLTPGSLERAMGQIRLTHSAAAAERQNP